ncbi:MAG: 4'-phosphopantetheinyl transferase superfamily protein [Agathobacter sp.]|nr:4'-phosphopantetheinyl transferase superfamily protein [Agathobacter sp.]
MMKLYVANVECLKDADTFEEYLCKVNEQRRAKVLRCKNEEDKKRTLLAGYLLAVALENEGYTYDNLEFSRTAEGKPYVEAHPEICFSISHSGKYAVCLISDQNVGVDVEYKNRKLLLSENDSKLLSVIKSSFSEEEFVDYQNTPKELQTEFFLRLWTRKEAVSKAMGKGLAMDFSKICVSDENVLSFWLDEEYYISVYREKDKLQKEDLEICMMN